MTGFMSTSLNVVSMAVSFFTATNLRAIVLRNEVIFSLRTVRMPPETITGGANGVAAFASVGFAEETCALTASSLVILPPTPDPCTWAGETPFSSKILPAAGEGYPAAYEAPEAAGTAPTPGAAADWDGAPSLISILPISPPIGHDRLCFCT